MTPLTPQIKERFVWYNVKYDKKMWIDYMIAKYQITKSIGTKLSNLISRESFTTNNFSTPRSIDKAVNMIIHNVPTPYSTELNLILGEPITNTLKEPITLSKDKTLNVGEMTTWLDLIRIKKKIKVSKKDAGIKFKDNYVLPKDWYVVINLDNFDEIYKYYEDKILGARTPEVGFGFSDERDSNYWGDANKSIPSKYQKITLQQFRKYVSKK